MVLMCAELVAQALPDLDFDAFIASHDVRLTAIGDDQYATGSAADDDCFDTALQREQSAGQNARSDQAARRKGSDGRQVHDSTPSSM